MSACINTEATLGCSLQLRRNSCYLDFSHSLGDIVLANRPQNAAVAPRARTEGLIVCELDDETLVHDRGADRACCLNAFAAEVWERCDGEAAPAEIANAMAAARGAPVDHRAVWLALDQLSRSGLLEAAVPLPATVLQGASRREVLRTLGLGAAAFVPAVTSIAVPPAAAQASPFPNGSPCTSGAQCASGFCSSGVCQPQPA